ncbi:DUF6795 domain-containing protein [Vibrio nigripulchritudo]|uniref:DUF6795 domain-containing protein n=1 Tax=Vibrio nigripulchritudo TaxID=28173 RepID=UPI0003B1F983|nr:DUF6795 domain-containing protein [Vibrio nigripulchritudo]CCN70487.1 exported hypothetical protein [Vibrio nigripulchritudo SFn118]
MKILRLFSYSFVLFFTFISYGNMLDFLKPYSYTLSPRISGIIQKLDEACPNLIVTLDVEYGGSYFTFDSTTDSKGTFSFDEVILHRWTKPSDLNSNVVAIRIFLEFNGEEKQLWGSYSDSIILDDFMIKNLSDLRCDLDSNKFQYNFENEKNGGAPYRVYGICDLSGYKERHLSKAD